MRINLMIIHMRTSHCSRLISHFVPPSNDIVRPPNLLRLRIQLHDVRLHLVKELPDVGGLVLLLGPRVDDHLPPVKSLWFLLKLDEREASLMEASKVLLPCIKDCHIVGVRG